MHRLDGRGHSILRVLVGRVCLWRFLSLLLRYILRTLQILWRNSAGTGLFSLRFCRLLLMRTLPIILQVLTTMIALRSQLLIEVGCSYSLRHDLGGCT